MSEVVPTTANTATDSRTGAIRSPQRPKLSQAMLSPLRRLLKANGTLMAALRLSLLTVLFACLAGAANGVDTRTLRAFMGHRSSANTIVYTSVTDKRIRNTWGK